MFDTTRYKLLQQFKSRKISGRSIPDSLTELRSIGDPPITFVAVSCIIGKSIQFLHCIVIFCITVFVLSMNEIFVPWRFSKLHSFNFQVHCHSIRQSIITTSADVNTCVLNRINKIHKQISKHQIPKKQSIGHY